MGVAGALLTPWGVRTRLGRVEREKLLHGGLHIHPVVRTRLGRVERIRIAMVSDTKMNIG